MSIHVGDYTFRNEILASDGREAHDAIVAWIDEADPSTRHACVLGWHYDNFGAWHVAYICCKPHCDLGTAVRVFLACNPDQLAGMGKIRADSSVAEIDNLARLIAARSDTNPYTTARLSSTGRPSRNELDATADDRLVVSEDRDFGLLTICHCRPTRCVIIVAVSEFHWPSTGLATHVADIVAELGDTCLGNLTTIEPGRIRQ